MEDDCTEFSAVANNNEAGDDENCSPFFNCGGCIGGIAFSHALQTFSFQLTKSPEVHMLYISRLSSFNRKLFQPPRVS
jgi:hypothetical protein